MIDGNTIRLKGAPAKRIFEMPCFTAWEYKGIAATGAEKYQEMHYPLDNGSKLYLKYYGNSHIMQLELSHTIYRLGNNYENMSYSQLIECFKSLCDWLQFYPSQTLSIMFEYGLTTTLPYSPDVLLSNMMFANKKPFKYSESQGYCESNLVRTQGTLKNYNKSTQYNNTATRAEQLHNLNILRTEVHLDKGQPVKKMGIVTLQDLLDKDKLHKLKVSHCDKLADTFIHDWRTDITTLTHQELINYTDWGNRQYWPTLWSKELRHKYEYQKDKAQQFYKKHNGILIATQLAEQVSNEWDILLNS
jgi:hypothetical protein